MKNEDVKNFLLKHRAKLNPQDYGFSTLNRRVKGLRREEVAQLAAVSVSWYTWLEQGRTIRISPAAVKRIGKVLMLSDVEQHYFQAIIFGGENESKQVEPPAEIIRMADALSPFPAFIRAENMDILYWNAAAAQKIINWATVPVADRNSLKLMFVSPEYKSRIHNWEKAAMHTIASFRAYYAASRTPEHFSSIIDDLTARSEAFREMWNYHEVDKVGSGKKSIIDDKGQLQHYTYASLKVENAANLWLICYMEDER